MEPVAVRFLAVKSVADCWATFRHVFRSKKLTELAYFAILEVYSLLCVAVGFRSKLISFEPGSFWTYDAKLPLNIPTLTTECLSHNLLAAESQILWYVATQLPWGGIIGRTHDRKNVLLLSTDWFSPAKELYQFDSDITAVFYSKKGYVFVGTKGAVWRSGSSFQNFENVLQLSNRESIVWHNHGIDENATELIIGEYACVYDNKTSSWRSVAHLHLSGDNGETWRHVDTLSRHSANKHIHLVKYSGQFERTIVTIGDGRKRSYWTRDVRKFVEPSLDSFRFDSFARGGGHTGFAEVDNAILMGTDHHGGTNSIIALHTCGQNTTRMLPGPYRRSPVINMHSIAHGDSSITFAFLHSGLRHAWKSALIYSIDGGDRWHRLMEYDGRIACFGIVNGGRGPDASLAITFYNVRDGETRTIILSRL